MKLFGLIGLVIWLSCSCVDKHRSHSLCEQSFIDSLEVRAQDSLFSNLPYSRSLLRNALHQTQDSMTYYRLMALYGKTFFVSSDFDSILYYNRPVKEYDKRATACPRMMCFRMYITSREMSGCNSISPIRQLPIMRNPTLIV